MTWPTKKLGEVCEISAGGSAPQGERFFENGKYPFFRTSDVGAVHLSDNLCDVRDYLNDEGIKKLNLFKKGTILFPKSGASTFLNHRVVMGCDGYVSSHLATISAGEKIDFKYLYFFLILIDAKDIAPNSSYPSLRIADIAKIEIPLPPLSEQKKIVAKLERVLAKISEAKKLRAEARENADNLLPAELHKIFSSTSSPQAPQQHPYKLENVGVFSNDKKVWEEKELGEVFVLNYGKGLPRSERSENGKYVVYGANGELGRSDKHLIEGDGLIIGRKGSAGEITRASGRYWPTDVTYFVTEDQKYDIGFAYYLFKFLNFPQYAVGVKPGINRNQIYEIKIPLPPLAEQKRIVKHLDSLSQKLKKLQEYQKSTQSDLLTFEQAILHKAFFLD